MPLRFEVSLIETTFRLLIPEDVPGSSATAMFVLFLVGFLVGTYAVVWLVKFIGGALTPTLPSLEAPVRKVVVRRRTVQVGSPAEQTFDRVNPDQFTPDRAGFSAGLGPVKPRPKVMDSAAA